MPTEWDFFAIQEAYNEGNYDAVIELCNDVLAHEPKNDEATWLKGKALRMKDEKRATTSPENVEQEINQQNALLKKARILKKEKSVNKGRNIKKLHQI